ncbi:MAG: hypothetical protein ACK5N9_21360, partial [Pirellula sp.]
SESAIGELEQLVQSIRDNPKLLAELGFDLSDLQKKLPGEVRESLNLEDKESISEILNEAYAYLLGHLSLNPSSEGRSSSLEDDS